MQPSPPRSDRELWAGVLSRDSEAFADLYRRHSARVHAHLRQRTDAVHAEDLTAEVFVTAWRKNADDPTAIHFDPEAGMLPWLLVCANNLLRNLERSGRRAENALRRIAVPPAEPDVAEAVADHDETTRKAAALRGVLDQLSVPDRELIQLCVVQGLAPTAVATAIGRPAGSVRSQLSRALSKARSLFNEQCVDATSSMGEPS